MINEFLKTYKDGGMVYLDPTERDRIVEEINRLKGIDESHQRLNGELREENDIAQEKVKSAIKEIERLHSIIKEVREYIKDACYLDEINYPNSLGHKQTMKVLAILDKENI